MRPSCPPWVGALPSSCSFCMARVQATCPNSITEQRQLGELHRDLSPCLVLQLSADPEGKNMCPRILKFNVLFYQDFSGFITMQTM
jgi:hypothetical protein